MNNKVLVKLIVPEFSEKYDIYLPINKKIGTIIGLISRAFSELNEKEISFKYLINSENGEYYDYDILIANTTIRNGSVIIVTK